MRITYEHELEELNKCLRDMAMMVEKAIEQTFVAFEDQNCKGTYLYGSSGRETCEKC